MELTTNDGTRIIEEESNITGFGKVMFSKDAVANIFALVDLMNVWIVTNNSSKQDGLCGKYGQEIS